MIEVNFTNEEFESKLRQLYKELTDDIKKTIEKKAFLLGGQPGAGKSGLTNIL